MFRYKKIYGISVRLLLCLAFPSIYNSLNAQNYPPNDSLIRISPGSFIQVRDSISFFLNDSLIRIPSGLVPTTISKVDKNLLYFDTLRQKANRKGFTRKLYDLVVISPLPVENKKISGSSQAAYLSYAGKRIKNINIVRLNVFGTNIDNPAIYNGNNFNSLLNRTHMNTNERIIRKNLLFSVGDTISPLTLSDNERILRGLPFIDDARIIVVPVSDQESDIIVVTKDIYSLGAQYDYGGLKRGNLSVFEKNILGTGHELGIEMPFDSNLPNSPGIGGYYSINNIHKSFINMKVDYLSGIGVTTYGINLSRKFVSAATRYAGGISLRQSYTSVNFDTALIPFPLKYNLQDYWLARSFLISRESVSRIIIGARYTNNNVFERPEILPETYYNLQRYRLYLGSIAYSVQKFYKTNLIYGYGRTEDIPYGALFRITAGREFNEYEARTYMGADISAGKSFPKLGYLYSSVGIASFFSGKQREQGLLDLKINYFSNLLNFGRYYMRNFINIGYTRGFDRYSDECIRFITTNGFTGFSNDSTKGTQRFTLSLESVLFSPANYHGFRFSFFGFSDFGFLSRSNQIIDKGFALTSVGLGLRVRNDNLLFNTLQIRLAFFPVAPRFSTIDNVTISGEQLLQPSNFDTGPPSIIPFR